MIVIGSLDIFFKIIVPESESVTASETLIIPEPVVDFKSVTVSLTLKELL